MRPLLPTLAVVTIGCAAEPDRSIGGDGPAPPEPELELGPDWSIVQQDATGIVLRHRGGNDGVRVTLAPGPDGRTPGVAPVIDGRTWEIREGGRVRPAFAPAHADRAVAAAAIQAQGPDLLIRLSGPPLDELIEHPLAPKDPVLSWVRLRPRAGSWRIVLQGLHTIRLAGPASVEERGRERQVDGPWGSFVLHDTPPVAIGASEPGAWWLDTTPSAHATEPYPRLSLTWTPLSP